MLLAGRSFFLFASQQIFSNVRLGKTLAQRGIDHPIEAPQLCSRIVKILDQLYLSCDDSFSEQGSGVVLAIDDDDSTDVSKEFLNVVMDKLDVSLTDDQKLSMLELAGSIKSGSLKMMSAEFSAVENCFCTEQMSDDNHDALLLAGQATHKQEYKKLERTTDLAHNTPPGHWAFLCPGCHWPSNDSAPFLSCVICGLGGPSS